MFDFRKMLKGLKRSAPLSEHEIEEMARRLDKIAPLVEEYYDIKDCIELLDAIDYLEAEGFITIDDQGRMTAVETT